MALILPLVAFILTCCAAGLSRAGSPKEPVFLAVCAPQRQADRVPQLTVLGTWTPASGLTDVSQPADVAAAQAEVSAKKWFRLSVRGQASSIGLLAQESAQPVDIGSPETGTPQRLRLGPCEVPGELFATNALSRAPRPAQKPMVWQPMAEWLGKQVVQSTRPQDPQAHRQAELSFKGPQGRSLGGGFTEVTLPFAVVLHRFSGASEDMHHDGLIWGLFGRDGRAPVVTAGGVTRFDGDGEQPNLDWSRPRLAYAGLSDGLWAVALTQENDGAGRTQGAVSVIIDSAEQAHVVRHVLSVESN